MTQDGISIRQASEADARRFNDALARLSSDLGDPHGTQPEDLLRHGFGTLPIFSGLLAETEDSAVVGALLSSPMFSTVSGAAGLYVSDLWVCETMRGRGLGRRLLAAAIEMAPADWNVRFLKLAVYDVTPRARAFYDRLGFAATTGETVMRLDHIHFDRLTDET
ncbi:GNAT family N-acetyltransferase [Stappia sp.]|uniref:GNAT family N-acetyltransferase n=1 Tax=Stappia sp. TaxID=1870903 RepID=UPI003C7E1CD0